ncbi:PREDICTED: polyadenylate-binding protein 2-like [Ipomoea nil]|uniref:polyadenylate-binding protein 2-like n=1 Tax=Ipomoea nil TaxID=35883 RepID=UPI0009016F43|nr:PREDICTED: polyadenylate-binding protein 2-like [Ipomoea nil]
MAQVKAQAQDGNPSGGSIFIKNLDKAIDDRGAPFARKQGRAKAMEVTNFTNVFVGNLSISTTEKDLREVFGHFGTIVSAVVVKDGDGKSEGFGFVNFNDADDAAWSVEVLNGHKFDNKEWYVRRAYQNKNVGKVHKKSVSTTNETESKKSVEAVQKGYRAITKVLYVDDKGVGHFNPRSP